MATITQILVGLRRVGLIGLQEAFKLARDSGASERDQLVDAMMSELARRNHIPASALADYRRAVWREYLRHRGEDIRHLYSEIDVVVRGKDQRELERIVELLEAVLAEHELRPVTTLAPPAEGNPEPQVLIQGEVVLEGGISEPLVRRAVRAQISDW